LFLLLYKVIALTKFTSECLFVFSYLQVVKTYMDGGDSVETESGEIRVNDRVVAVIPDKPILTPEECKYSMTHICQPPDLF